MLMSLRMLVFVDRKKPDNIKCCSLFEFIIYSYPLKPSLFSTTKVHTFTFKAGLQSI